MGISNKFWPFLFRLGFITNKTRENDSSQVIKYQIRLIFTDSHKKEKKIVKMTQVKRQPQSSASSQFLNNEDSTIVVKILGPRCPSLATSVVQIYMSDATTGMKHIHLTGLDWTF